MDCLRCFCGGSTSTNIGAYVTKLKPFRIALLSLYIFLVNSVVSISHKSIRTATLFSSFHYFHQFQQTSPPPLCIK